VTTIRLALSTARPQATGRGADRGLPHPPVRPVIVPKELPMFAQNATEPVHVAGFKRVMDGVGHSRINFGHA
jgi:hypothetical protein